MGKGERGEGSFGQLAEILKKKKKLFSKLDSLTFISIL